MIGGEVLHHADSTGYIQSGVDIHGHSDILASSLGHHINQFDHTFMLDLAGVKIEAVFDHRKGLITARPAVCADVNIYFERRKSAFQHFIHYFFDLDKIHAGVDLAISIDPDFVAELAAH